MHIDPIRLPPQDAFCVLYETTSGRTGTTVRDTESVSSIIVGIY